MSTVTKLYRNKSESSVKRGINFELTFEQFLVYRNEMKEGYCDYTGVKLSLNTGSLERIDRTKGYTVDNCCVVTQRINHLKDRIIDEGGDYVGITETEREQLKALRRKLESGFDFTLKYKQRLGLLGNEYSNTSVSEDKVMMENNEINCDVEIAKSYLKFCENNNVSFNAYKKAYTRSTCAITKRKFEDNGYFSKVITSRDGGVVTDKNITAVVSVVAHVLKSGLSAKEIANIVV
jgi:hypothetical protein